MPKSNGVANRGLLRISNSLLLALVTVMLAASTQGAAPINQTIWLRAAATGLHVSADLNRGSFGPLVADRTTVGAWEQFQVIDAGSGFIALRSVGTGLFVSADLNRGVSAPLVADRSTVGSWERYQWIELAGGSIALLGQTTGRYVSAELNVAAYAPLVSDRTAVSTWESFTWGNVSASGATVSIWLTTGSRSSLLARQANLRFDADTSTPGTLTINVNDAISYQQMDGFGGALTDSSAWLIQTQLSASQRDSFMRALFSPTTGIGMSFLRLPMGASDFALNHYSYDDLPAGQTDPTLARFSIAHDQAYIIPVLRQALSLNPNLKVMGSPWSAPGWMKTSGSLITGRLLPQYYGAYANYFVRFIQAYQSAGVPIYAITPQNEPFFEPGNYPGMRWEPGDVANFIKNNLGPSFASAQINTKIIVWDHNWDVPTYPMTVLNDPAAKAFIDGSAFHCYAGSVSAQTTVHNAHPDRKIYFTECTSGAWSTNWSANLVWDLTNLLIGATRNWSSATIKFNLALDQNFGPHTGGCPNCIGITTINQTTGAVTLNHDYYAIGHFSKFVMPGAVRINSNQFESNGLLDVAFRNPDGSKVVVVLNSQAANRTFKILWAGQSITYTLPGSSVATFRW